MSADRWSVCPACYAAALAHRAGLAERVEAEYGRIPMAEHDELRAAAAEPIDLDKLRTFREDYAIVSPEYGGHVMEVAITYRGCCSTCGAHVDDHAATLPVAAEGRAWRAAEFHPALAYTDHRLAAALRTIAVDARAASRASRTALLIEAAGRLDGTVDRVG